MSEDLSWARPCSSTSTSPRTATTGTSSRASCSSGEHRAGASRRPRARSASTRASARVRLAGVVGEPRVRDRALERLGGGVVAAWRGDASSWTTAPSSRRPRGADEAWCAVGVWGRGRDYLGRTDRRTHRRGCHLDVDRVPPARSGQRAARARLHPAPRGRVADRDARDGRRDRGLGHRLGDQPRLRRTHVGGRRPGRPRRSCCGSSAASSATASSPAGRPRARVAGRRAARTQLPEASSTRTGPTSRPAVDDEMADIEALLRKRGIE